MRKKLDWSVFVLALLLVSFGVLMVFNASVAEALRDFDDKYFYLKSQAVAGVAGLIAMFIVAQINYKLWQKLSWPLFGVSLVFLVLVLILGFRIQGARRWLILAGFNFQPSELVKLTFIIYLSSWLAEKKRTIWQFLFVLGLTVGLVILEPDLGTSLIIGLVGLLVYFISGVPWIQFLGLSLAGMIAVAGLILSSSYRRARLMTFLDPTADPLGSSYHIRQVLIALGSGGWWGVGLGQSRQKYSYLPEVASDSIFAIVAEEMGFLGSLLVLVMFFWLIFKIFKIAQKAPDQFSRFLASGIGIWLGFQLILNLAAMVALVPLTGIPLPLISFGGSSLVVALIGIGMVLNISKYSEPD